MHFQDILTEKDILFPNMKIGSDITPAKYTCAGLFAHTDTATIQNLEIKEGYIHIKPSSIPGLNSERTYVGLLVGYAGLTDTSGTRGTVIDHCSVSGQIRSDSVESNLYRRSGRYTGSQLADQ